MSSYQIFSAASRETGFDHTALQPYLSQYVKIMCRALNIQMKDAYLQSVAFRSLPFCPSYRTSWTDQYQLFSSSGDFSTVWKDYDSKLEAVCA